MTAQAFHQAVQHSADFSTLTEYGVNLSDGNEPQPTGGKDVGFQRHQRTVRERLSRQVIVRIFAPVSISNGCRDQPRFFLNVTDQPVDFTLRQFTGEFVTGDNDPLLSARPANHDNFAHPSAHLLIPDARILIPVNA